MPSSRRRAAWVFLRVPVALALAGAVALAARDVLLARLIAITDVHGTVKALLEAWHAALLHLPQSLGVAAVLAISGGLVPLCAGRAASTARAMAIGVLVPLVGRLPGDSPGPLRGYPPTAFVLLALALTNLVLAGRPWPRALLRVPGLEWLFPLPTLGALGLLPHAGLRALSLLPLAGLYAVADAGLGFQHYELAVADWPDSRTEPRLKVVARAANGVRSEFHNIDIVPLLGSKGAAEGWRAIVVAETSLKLWSFPLTFSAPSARAPASLDLPPWWGPEEGLVMDSETDPATDTTWFLDGPDRVTSAIWEAGASPGTGAVPGVTPNDGPGAWRRMARSERLPAPLTHAYTRWIPERQQLVLTTINARNPHQHPMITTLRTPTLDQARSGEPWVDSRRPLPMARDIAWIPPLDRLVLAPDFGDRLYLVNLDTWHAEPWVELPTQNGKMVWVDGYQRLVAAVPSEPWVYVIDPVAGATERRIPTQLGVRAIAVDTERGLLLTASVLTGQVQVQRWEDGRVVDRLGTVMPMVRELSLIPGTGEALLGTWTRVYHFRYAP